MKTPWWFLHKTPIAILLLPVSGLYYLIGRLVYFFRKFGAYKSRRQIICVGNILAGGVGKTPIVRAIAMRLNAPVVMRGYKKTAQTNGAGDEALMLARDGIQVHTGHRKSNIILLNRQSDNTPIVMDDGLQNPSIKKDVSILVFDEGLGYGNGFLLPSGPLRTPKKSVARADAIIVIRSGTPRKKFKLPENVPVFYAHNKTVSPYNNGQKLFAFAGIGYPKKFFAALSGVVGRRAFADHYQYTDEDIEALRQMAARRGAKLVTTEKDWVRLPENVREEIKFAKLETVIDEQFFTWLAGKIK
ncbi:MAG: tetraacyldisaccharide 4'-kinase [Muribaculaceae bacterium]|nr:tetraacyldisaccharide 4'-kinase [Muribaculaceae bacterium]